MNAIFRIGGPRNYFPYSNTWLARNDERGSNTKENIDRAQGTEMKNVYYKYFICPGKALTKLGKNSLCLF